MAQMQARTQAQTQPEARAMVPVYAREHVETVSGALLLARDLAELMFAASEKEEERVPSCEVDEWARKIDFLLNAITTAVMI